MCGIVSLTYKNDNPEMGKEAAALLRRLEYRGYDSTGASFIGEDLSIGLAKKVGAPSRVCRELGIEGMRGQRFIGQVRWATYGAVTDVNSQPHRVRCKIEMVGAHNGNISNTDALKPWLTARGHTVVSDNDGEIVVHLVEEHYAANLSAPATPLAEMRRAFAASGIKTEGASIPDSVFLMIDAIRKAEAIAEGSYAAAVSDPRVSGVFAIKSGSSLYCGRGADKRGDFFVVSSDLTSVLSKTRALVPLAEGEGVWFTEHDYVVFSLKGEIAFSRPRPKRSKLAVRDTALDPRYKHYMEQEILGSPANIETILRYYFKDPAAEALAAALEEKRDLAKEVADRCAELSDLFGDRELAQGAEALFSSQAWTEVWAKARSAAGFARAEGHGEPSFVSDERELLAELLTLVPARAAELALADSIFVWRKRRAVTRYLGELGNAIRETAKAGGKVYLVASGTSYHASLTGAYFFAGLAGMPVYPCNPGMFRSMYLSSLSPSDLLLGISQSGETKDLVDIFQDVRDQAKGVVRACLVNNENSRIPQELCDFYLPILCGPEIAVAATKSFLNQIVILYLVAAGFSLPERAVADKVREIQALVEKTLASAAVDVEQAAQHLFLRPSLHILGTGLIGLAREGALKIREVVLNHAEGYDAAEFKHGPNTILGKSTIFSVDDLAAAIDAYRSFVEADPALGRTDALDALRERPQILESAFRDYPLVFVCPPDDRDARITVSQIHTHKIRGAEIILVAERRADLAAAALGKPMGNDDYWSDYIEVPHSGDPRLFVFSAAVILQYLAYRMSVKKMAWLDALRVVDHGVHPDAPKNVSKSITVD